MNTYSLSIPIYHADLYRIRSEQEFEELDLIKEAASGLLVVEWPERAGTMFGPEAWTIRIVRPDDSESRTLHISAPVRSGHPEGIEEHLRPTLAAGIGSAFVGNEPLLSHDNAFDTPGTPGREAHATPSYAVSPRRAAQESSPVEHPGEQRAAIAWDTSAGLLDVVLRLGDRDIHYSERAGRRHNELLGSAIARMLRENGLTAHDLSTICCARGPGSFTGLRIGMSTAKGLAAACAPTLTNSCPVLLAIPTLSGYAAAHAKSATTPTNGPRTKVCEAPAQTAPLQARLLPSDPTLAIIDGRKNRYYAQLFADRRSLWGPYDAALSTIVDQMAERDIHGVTMVGPDNEMALEGMEPHMRDHDIHVTLSNAYWDGIAGSMLDIAAGCSCDDYRLGPSDGPDYLRGSQAEE